MLELDPLISAIGAGRKSISRERAMLVGISGIDASGKGFVTQRICASLGGFGDPGYNVAVIGVDDWLNLPHVRFDPNNPAEHFYEHAIRFEVMFETLILPLKKNRRIDLQMEFTDETASDFRKRRYQFREVDIILLEGIFLLKNSLRHYFDLTCWVDCSCETALARAVERCQEGLPPLETVRAFTTIYFPAQQIHFKRDAPRENAALVMANDDKIEVVASTTDFAFQDVRGSCK